MKTGTTRRFRRRAWRVILVAGAMLVGLMVTTEGEPGALPLTMVLVGALGTALDREKRSAR